MTDILQSKKVKPERTNGIRTTLLETYFSKGREEAYKQLDEYNKKIGSTVYTRETLEKWIAEEQRKKGYREDDGFDR